MHLARFNSQLDNALFPSQMWVAVHLLTFCIDLGLKNSLVSFIERETLVDYDREAEAALQRLTNGEVDINKLTNSWAKAYSEVRAQSQL